MTITFDEKLEAAWGLHKIEKAVFEKEVAELRAENEQLRKDLKTAIMGDSAELADVKRENVQLREALKPFAYYASQIPDDVSDTAAASGTVGDLRAAAAALGDK